MRIFFSVAVFFGSLIVMTIACTWAWDAFINNRIYNCTDALGLDYLRPGNWVHKPVEVTHVVGGRSMSEPDTIKSGWSTAGLWIVWTSFVAGSLAVSFLVARAALEGKQAAEGDIHIYASS